jgi:hypothetical protein
MLLVTQPYFYFTPYVLLSSFDWQLSVGVFNFIQEHHFVKRKNFTSMQLLSFQMVVAQEAGMRYAQFGK